MDIIVFNLFYLYSEYPVNVMGNIPTSIYCMMSIFSVDPRVKVESNKYDRKATSIN